jgi:hypothetical protein
LNTAQFEDLCHATCMKLNLEDPNQIQDRGCLHLDGVDIGLFFDEDVEPSCVFCYVDLGDIAEEKRPQIYEHLLTMNVVSGSHERGVFAVDPATRNAVLLSRLRPPATDAATMMARTVRRYVDSTLKMREDLLKGKFGEAPGPGRDPLHRPEKHHPDNLA